MESYAAQGKQRIEVDSLQNLWQPINNNDIDWQEWLAFFDNSSTTDDNEINHHRRTTIAKNGMVNPLVGSIPWSCRH